MPIFEARLVMAARGSTPSPSSWSNEGAPSALPSKGYYGEKEQDGTGDGPPLSSFMPTGTALESERDGGITATWPTRRRTTPTNEEQRCHQPADLELLSRCHPSIGLFIIFFLRIFFGLLHSVGTLALQLVLGVVVGQHSGVEFLASPSDPADNPHPADQPLPPSPANSRDRQ